MALLPAELDPSAEIDVHDVWLDSIADQIAEGKRPEQIAREIHPTDLLKRRHLRFRIWRHVRKDAELHSRIAERARGELVLALIPTTRALAGRAARGRVDAAKVVLEASGFHNPRVKHEHSGEINIKLSIPRPKAVDVPDADVVED
jgi:hypothetical protein